MMFYTQLYDHFNWQDPIFADIYTSIYLFYLQKILNCDGTICKEKAQVDTFSEYDVYIDVTIEGL